MIKNFPHHPIPIEPSATPVRSRTPSFAVRLFAILQSSGLFIALGFLFVMVMRAPYLDPADFDYDEGINLMKSLLVNQGYHLYSDIWSDQPPIFTLMLSSWMSLLGQTVAVARWLMILLSMLLLWSFYQIARHATSNFSATVVVILLIISEYYLRLSGAVMIGLPSIALAMVSLAFLLVGQERNWKIFLSAILMSAAIQTKLMAGLALPGVLIYLLISGRSDKSTLFGQHYQLIQRYRSALFWLLTCTISFLGIGFLSQSLDVEQLLISHFGAQTRNHSPFVTASASFLPNFVDQHLPYLMVGAMGLFWAVWSRMRAAAIPSIWLGTALIALAFHRPVWYHHVLYLSVPLVWLCAYGIEAWRQTLLRVMASNSLPTRTLQLASMLLIGLVFAIGFWRYPSPIEERLADQIAFSRPHTTPPIMAQLVVDANAMHDKNAMHEEVPWIFTDRPYYAFLAGQAVPPELAVFSRKRLSTGGLTEQSLLDIIAKYQPEIVLLERFTYDLGPELMAAIERDYQIVLDMPPARYYRRVGTASAILP